MRRDRISAGANEAIAIAHGSALILAARMTLAQRSDFTLMTAPAEPSPELLSPALQLKREWSPWPEICSDPGNPRELGWWPPRKHPCRDPGLRPSCVSLTPQLKSE